MILPTKKVEATRVNPKKLIIYSKPKAGKSTLVAELPNALHLDLEEGLNFISSQKIDVIKEAREQKKDPIAVLSEIGKKIKEAGNPYEYIIIDTITKLEDLVLPLAKKSYMDTPQGKTFTGDSILELPNGAGYLWLRIAFNKVLDTIYTWADNIILLGHLRAKSIEKEGKEVEAADLDLSGKLKSIVSADVDAIALLQREGDKTYLNFITSDEIICGSRAVHLRNQKILVAETIDGVYKTCLLYTSPSPRD